MRRLAPARVADKFPPISVKRNSFGHSPWAPGSPRIAEGPDDVAEVRAEAGYRLYVRFFDRTDGYVEMKEKILGTGARGFAELADPRMFAQVGIAFGSVLWSNGMNLVPDTMYEELKRNGVWVPR